MDGLPEEDDTTGPAALVRARRDIADANRRLQLLTGATRSIGSGLDPAEATEHMVQIAVPDFADWCLLAVVDATPPMFRLLHRDPRHRAAAEVLCRHFLGLRGAASRPVQHVLAEGQPTLISTVTDEFLEQQVRDPEVRQAYRDFGMRSVIIAPLWVRGRVIGNASFVRADSRSAVFTDADMLVAAELAQRTALALDNARLLARERAAAETLQRSLLPELPAVPGLRVAARYLPANNDAHVGGDWYDVLPLPDGAIGIAIGDVMGHDLEAAAAMGQLRSVLRAFAWDGAAPAVALSRLDHLVSGLHMGRLATAVYGRLRLAPDGNGNLEYANAGHHAPVLRLPTGATELLEDAHAPMIGLPAVSERSTGRVAIPAGATLVMYTDGLVEDRLRAADQGIGQLRRVLENAPADSRPDDLCDLIVDRLRPSQNADDDIALLVIQLDRS